jgi:acetoacetyl-CoA synthetase
MVPLWAPSIERKQSSLLTAFAQQEVETTPYVERFDYLALHDWSIEQREAFWSRVWEFCGVLGQKGEPILVDGHKMPGAQWFPEATLNFAQNLLRQRPEDDAVIIFRGEREVRRILSFGRLKREVAALAAHLLKLGITPGDRVAAYTHNGPETIVGMLAASSIGAIWSSCSPDFGATGVLDRFRQIEPKALIISDGYFYKSQKIDRLQQAREIAAGLPSVVETLVVPYIYSEPSLRGFSQARLWPKVLRDHEDAELRFVQLPFDHPLYIVFSSGTTGAPKCIVHGAGGTLLQHLKEHQLQCDIRPGDRVFYATTTGWMMWNWLASALASRATILLYDGFPMESDGNALLEFAQEQRATFFGVSAGYLRAIEKLGLKPKETHDLGALRVIASTGAPLAPDSFCYVYRDIKQNVQLASISGGTDILSCFVGGNPWGPVYRGEIQCAELGMAVEVWDNEGRRRFGAEGELVCTRAFPSMPIGFWNDPEGPPHAGGGKKYLEAYFSRFPGIWRHGDYATQTVGGGFVIHGRSDATLNPQGVRIGTADIYKIVEAQPEVEEALAIAQQLDGVERIILFVKMRFGSRLNDALSAHIKQQLREQASPRHVPALIIEAPELPHTRSGKLVELAVRDVIHGRPVKNLEAIANPGSLNFFSNLSELASPPRRASAAAQS